MKDINPVTIESTANPKIRALVKLRQRKSRDEQGLMIIDGAREIRFALSNKFKLCELYVCRELIEDFDAGILKLAKDCAVTIIEVSKRVFEKIAFGDRLEGFVAVAKQVKKTLEDLPLTKESALVLLEAIEKPGNLGAIMRTCEAAGIDAVLVCDGKTDIFNPNVIRASTGACFSLPIVEVSSQDAIQWLKEKKIKIISAVPGANLDYWQADLSTPCAIVFGCEDKGISQAMLATSEVKISIPMRGKVDSLNVSTSAAVILYELLRQRSQKNPR